MFDKIEEELKALSQKKTVTTKKDENVVKVKKPKLCLDFDESDEEDEQNENSVKRELAAYRSETVLGVWDWMRILSYSCCNLIL